MNKRTLYKLAIWAGVLNYLVFAVLTVLAGGDSFRGHIAGGHYFAAAGGGFVEIGRILFELCRWHAYSLLVSFPLLFWGGLRLAPLAQDQDDLVPSQGD